MSDVEITYSNENVIIVTESESNNEATIIVVGVDEVPSVIESIETGPQGPQGPPGEGVVDAIRSVSAPGGYIIKNIRMDENKKIVITYDDTPVE